MATESAKKTKRVRKRETIVGYAEDSSRMERLRETSKGKTIVFGSWKIKAPALPLRETIARVESSSLALSRMKKRLVTPGVKLSQRKNVPLYRADPTQPNVLIREVNGQTERVQLIDGEFKLVE
jgi:hypothetical protein